MKLICSPEAVAYIMGTMLSSTVLHTLGFSLAFIKAGFF